MAKKDIEKHQFKKGQSGNPKGRPKKLVSHITEMLKKEGYDSVTANHIKDAYLTLINLPIKEVQDIASSSAKQDYPLLYKLVAKELLGKRGAEMLEKLLDRSIGKSSSSVDITSNGNTINLPISTWTKEDE